jgi:hypothetical protein
MDSNEDDTYRMIERMQDVSPEDQVEDDEMKEIERMDRQIQDEQLHIQEHESDNDNIPDEDEVDQEQDNDDEEEEIEEEEDDDEEEEEDDDQEIQDDQDIENEEIGPFDFKNDDEAEFFENLPISSPQTQEEEEDDHLKDIEEEEDLHNNTEDDEDELDELDEEEALAQATMPIPQESKVEAPIPWQRPNPYGKIDTSSFYQDENAIRVVEKSRFKVWHGITILVILVLAYRSLPRKKVN